MSEEERVGRRTRGDEDGEKEVEKMSRRRDMKRVVGRRVMKRRG